jgi:hypothetical protein
MYIHTIHTINVPFHAQMVKPFGPGFPAELAERASKMEVWATNFEDSGEYTEFRLFDDKGELLGIEKIEGY